MESFILFPPFPLHSKFKFSIKILAFDTLSKFIFALCGWRNFLEFKHKLFGNCEEELPKKPVGRQSVDSWPSVGRQSADSRPFVGRQLADSWPTVGR